jgi:hypothetical protein
MRIRICLGRDRVRLGALTRSLPSSIGVLVDTAAFALSDANASLCQPALLGERLAPWSPLDAHSLGCLCPSLLIGRDIVLMR